MARPWSVIADKSQTHWLDGNHFKTLPASSCSLIRPAEANVAVDEHPPERFRLARMAEGVFDPTPTREFA